MTETTMRWLILPDIHDKLRRANQIIERDLYFEPGPFTQVMGRERRNGH